MRIIKLLRNMGQKKKRKCIILNYDLSRRELLAFSALFRSAEHLLGAWICQAGLDWGRGLVRISFGISVSLSSLHPQPLSSPQRYGLCLRRSLGTSQLTVWGAQHEVLAIAWAMVGQTAVDEAAAKGNPCCTVPIPLSLQSMLALAQTPPISGRSYCWDTVIYIVLNHLWF